MTVAYKSTLGELFDTYNSTDVEFLTDQAVVDLGLTPEQVEFLRVPIRSAASTWLDGRRRVATEQYFVAKREQRAAQVSGDQRAIARTSHNVLDARKALLVEFVFNGERDVQFKDATEADLQGAIEYTRHHMLLPAQEKIDRYQQMIVEIKAAGVTTWGQVK